MKKIFLLYILCLVSFQEGFGQKNDNRDSLKQRLSMEESNTAKVNLLYDIARSYIKFFIGYGSKKDTDSAVSYVQKAILLATFIDYQQGEAEGLLILGSFNRVIGNYSQSIVLFFKALHIYEDVGDKENITNTHMYLMATYRDAGDYTNALSQAFTAKQFIYEKDGKLSPVLKDNTMKATVIAEIGNIYQYLDVLDSAEFYARKSIDGNLLYNGASWNFPVYLLGTIQAKQGRYKEAMENYRTAIRLAIENDISKDTLDIYNSIATLYKRTDNLDSALHYAKAITDKWDSISIPKILLTASATLFEIYKAKDNTDSALKYLALNNTLKDSIYNTDRHKEFQNVGLFIEQLREQEIEKHQQHLKSRIIIYSLIAGAFVLLVIALLLYRNNLHKKHAKLKIEKSYDSLKSAQAQLIQSEKMASLGELTAGIAHEIQNPLNFVNNFSEVNRELLLEMKEEIEKGNTKEIKLIADDVIENEEKINHHGKRADAIVKNMLQHSKSTSSQKEPTAINKLADEYLRLSFHGFRAKDKSFNATMKTDFDESINKINVIPQDIGRVLLNLYNNAFYAVNEKSMQQAASSEPTVSVTTKKLNNAIELTVKDNGNGIPKNIVDKIFQPFFTTKPTGQGTGLGLSLSYDIIKAHAGDITVQSKEGEGSKFTIRLPIFNSGI